MVSSKSLNFENPEHLQCNHLIGSYWVVVSGDTVGFSVVFRNEICVISLLKIDTLSSPYGYVLLSLLLSCVELQFSIRHFFLIIPVHLHTCFFKIMIHNLWAFICLLISGMSRQCNNLFQLEFSKTTFMVL